MNVCKKINISWRWELTKHKKVRKIMYMFMLQNHNIAKGIVLFTST